MVILDVKVIYKAKHWLDQEGTIVKPFLDAFRNNGYQIKESKDDYGIFKDGKLHACFNAYDMGDGDDPNFSGVYYARYVNIEVKKKTMLRMSLGLWKRDPVSEAEKQNFVEVIGILKHTPEWQPDFEYDFSYTGGY